MHILFLPSWYPASPADIGGSFFREQALALHRSECKVGVIAPSMASLRKPLAALRESWSGGFEDDESLPTYRKTIVNWTPRFWRSNASRYARIGWRLYQNYSFDHGRPDLIHVHASLLGGAAALEIKRRTGIRFVLSEHSTAYSRGLVPNGGLRLAKKIAEQAERCFAVSTPLARLLEERLSMPAESWSVMPNSVNQSFLDAPLPIPRTGKFRFLHVSLLDEKKRVELIIKAFAQSFDRIEEAELIIGGDGPTRPALEALASRLGLAGRVRFLGRLSRDQVRQEMGEADAFVLSSKHETFGVVIIEAIAMGLPCIATRCGGPEDIVDADTGLLVPVEDVNAIGAAMREVLAKPGRYDRERLRRLCKERFGPQAITRRWKENYQSLIVRQVDV